MAGVVVLVAVTLLVSSCGSGGGASSVAVTTATPTFSLSPGTYSTSQVVTISDSTPSATIYYTTDGTKPTSASTTYTVPIKIASTETIEAIAIASGDTSSAVASAAYTIGPPPVTATPTFSPVAGTYTSAQSVTIMDATSGAAIYYTTDGSTPNTTSLLYSAPIQVSSTETIEAIAIANGDTSSAVASATYTIGPPPVTAGPSFSPAPGSYSSAQSVSLTDVTSGAAIYYTTDGSTPTTSSPIYSAPIQVSSTETIQAIAVATGDSPSPVTTATYTITSPNPPKGTYTITVTGTDSTTSTITGSTTFTFVID